MDGWKWYASHDDEVFSVSGDTREEVIAEGRDTFAGDFVILEGRTDPLDLSRFVHVDSFYEQLAEDVDEEHGDPDAHCELLESITNDQIKDLERHLQKAVRAWQDTHEIVVKPWAFTQTRNRETIA